MVRHHSQRLQACLLLFITIIPCSFPECLVPEIPHGFFTNDDGEEISANSVVSTGTQITLTCDDLSNPPYISKAKGPSTCISNGTITPHPFLTPCYKLRLTQPQNNVQSRAVYAMAAERNDMPWSARLNLSFSGCPVASTQCGASLVANRWLLTAAHCKQVENRPKCQLQKIFVQIGRVNFSDPDTQLDEQNFTVSAINFFTHPNYESVEGGYDLGLIKLDEPVNFTETVQTIKLPDYCDSDLNRTRQTTSVIDRCTHVRSGGWGKTETDSLSTALLYVNLLIVPRQFCEVQLKVENIKTQKLCAIGDNDSLQDMCQGDSGGALICDKSDGPRVIGVVSYGQGCGAAQIPGVYARVCSGLRWINETMNGSNYRTSTTTSRTTTSTKAKTSTTTRPSSAELGRRLLSFAMQGNTEGIRLMFSKGFVTDVNYKDAVTGRTALIIASGQGSLPIVTLLLQNKASINAVDNSNQTAFMAAAGAGSVEIIRLLLAKNADPTLKNSNGETAVDIARKRGFVAVLVELPGGETTMAPTTTVSANIAEATTMPWLARLTLIYSGCNVNQVYCAGSLVDPRWILTAAHCKQIPLQQRCFLSRIVAELGRSNFGDPDTESDEQNFTVSAASYFEHPEYESTEDGYDFALIKLAEPVNITESVKTVKLPDYCDSENMLTRMTTSAVDQCIKVRTAGWGDTVRLTNEASITYVNLTVVSRRTCTNRLNGNTNIGLNKLCAVADAVHSANMCAINGGAPLVCDKDDGPHLIGVDSYGSAQCGQQGVPEVFARVCSALQWIQQTIVH